MKNIMYNPDEKLFFEFKWTIENITMCRRRADEPIKSPNFMVHLLLDTEWFVQLCPKGLKDENTIMCFLHRTNVGPEKVDVKYSISVDESNCKARQIFRKGSRSEKMVRINRGRYSQDLKKFGNEGNLNVVCRLWPDMVKCPRGMRPYPVWCSARSHVPVEKRKVPWSIKNFASLPSQHEVSTSVVSASATAPKLLVTLSWSDETQKGGGKLKMEIREMPDELVGKIFQLGCRFQLLDAEDQLRTLASGWHLFTNLQKRFNFLGLNSYSDSVWNFELDIDRADLNRNWETLLRNGELLLECDFNISCDPMVCLIEDTGFVHRKPKLPPKDVEVQAEPNVISWNNIFLGEFNNENSILNYFFLLSVIFKNKFFLLFLFVVIISKHFQYTCLNNC